MFGGLPVGNLATRAAGDEKDAADVLAFRSVARPHFTCGHQTALGCFR